MKQIQDELELLKGLAGNDRQAVETIYKQHYAVIQSFILNNHGTSDDASDIFQEAMVVLYEKAMDPAFSLQCQIRTYLYSVSRRLWLKRLHQMQRFGNTIESMDETVPVEEDLEEQERKNAAFTMLEHAIQHLGEPCKSLLESYYVKQQNMQEIAESFGYTNADNAKTQKYKCLMRLKKLFFAQYKNGN